MSELSELISINRNIEKQNEEIIRLLRIIAGESGEDVEEESPMDSYIRFVNEELIPEVPDLVMNSMFESPLGVGEVYFFDDDPFKLTIKNNDLTIDNLNSEGECSDYALAELIANESIKHNQSLDDSTVILTDSSTGKLPQILKQCVEGNAKKIYLPLRLTIELLGAPQEIQTILEINHYKSTEDLIEKLFGKKDSE